MVIGVFPNKADGIAEPGESLNVQDSMAHHLLLYEIGIGLPFLYKKVLLQSSSEYGLGVILYKPRMMPGV